MSTTPRICVLCATKGRARRATITLVDLFGVLDGGQADLCGHCANRWTNRDPARWRRQPLLTVVPPQA